MNLVALFKIQNIGIVCVAKPKCCLDFDKDACYCKTLKTHWELRNGECEFVCPHCCGKCNEKKHYCEWYKDFWFWKVNECVFECPSCCKECDSEKFTCKKFKKGWIYQEGQCQLADRILEDSESITQHSPQQTDSKDAFDCPKCCDKCGKHSCKKFKDGWGAVDGKCIPVSARDAEVTINSAPEDTDGGFACPICCTKCGKDHCKKVDDGWTIVDGVCIRDGPTIGGQPETLANSAPDAPQSSCLECCEDCAGRFCKKFKDGWTFQDGECTPVVQSQSESSVTVGASKGATAEAASRSTSLSFVDENGEFTCPSCCNACGNGWCKELKDGWTVKDGVCIPSTSVAGFRPESEQGSPPTVPSPTVATAPQFTPKASTQQPPAVGSTLQVSSQASSRTPLPVASTPQFSSSASPLGSSCPECCQDCLGTVCTKYRPGWTLQNGKCIRSNPLVGRAPTGWVCPLCCEECGISTCKRYKDFWVYRNGQCRFECPECCGECDEKKSTCYWYKWSWTYKDGQCKFECPHCCGECDTTDHCKWVKEGWSLVNGECVQGVQFGQATVNAITGIANSALDLAGGLVDAARGIIGRR